MSRKGQRAHYACAPITASGRARYATRRGTFHRSAPHHVIVDHLSTSWGGVFNPDRRR